MSISIDEAYEQARWEEYQEELIEDALKEISRGGISHYIYTYGNAIETRIRNCIEAAKDLHEKKHYGSSVVCSCTAVEVTIQYFILRPLVQGMFLNEEWAEILTRRIVSGIAAKDREVLPSILKFWEVDINSVKLSSDEPLWQLFHKKIWKARNGYAHRGDPVPKEISAQAIEAATILTKLAKKVLMKAMGHSRWRRGKFIKSPFSHK